MGEAARHFMSALTSRGVRIRTMSVFTRRASCESHGIVERTLILAMKVAGIGVAVPGYVTRIRFSSRETSRRESGSQVLLTAGLIRQGATDGARCGDYLRLAPGVGTLTLPPTMPTFVQDDGRFRSPVELFIVLRTPSPQRVERTTQAPIR